MKVTPVNPTASPENHGRKYRAFMTIHNKSHIVTDTVTGERKTLPMAEAWELHKKINMLV